MRSILDHCSLATIHTSAVLALAVGARLPAQEPGAAPAPVAPRELRLESLQSLLTGSVHAIQPTARGDESARAGVAASRLVAHVRDAEFDVDGRLTTLLVEPPLPDAGAATGLRKLPAADVRWHDTHGWTVINSNLQFAELPEARDPAAVEATKAKGEATAYRATRLAQAVLAVPRAPATEAGNGTPAAAPSSTAPSPVIWLAPAAQRLCFLTTTQEPLRAVPWSLVQVTNDAQAARLDLRVSAEQFASAPTCATPGERPGALMRSSCYRHFGTAPPAWDNLASPAAKPDR